MLSIDLENLSHTYQRGTSYEKTALRNITLHIEPGVFLGVAGRSGSGKTTLIQHINGLLKPTGGRLLINGAPAEGARLLSLKREAGIVFQNPEHQLFEETVYRDISFGLSGSGLSAAETDDRVLAALKGVGLDESIIGRSPFQLSGGEKRRVAIAGVLAMNPSILILDEPTAGLDPGGRREIMDFIRNLRRERAMTVVLATHDMEEMARLCDRVVVLKDGKVALEGDRGKVFRNQVELEKAGLEPPRMTSLMMRLKESMPEISDEIFTVEEAAEELRKYYLRQGFRRREHDKRLTGGQVSSRKFDPAQVGS